MKYFFAFLILSTIMVAGCGIKPSKLQSPSGDEKSQFPSTYPKKD